MKLYLLVVSPLFFNHFQLKILHILLDWKKLTDLFTLFIHSLDQNLWHIQSSP